MKKYLTLGLISLLSFLAGKYLFPPKPQVKEVVKVVTVEKKVQNKDKVVKSTKIKKPDGTVITETEVSEKTKTFSDKSSQSNTVRTSSGAKIGVGVLAMKRMDKFSEDATFGVNLVVPLFGNVKAQALGTTDKRLGLGLMLEF